MTNIKKLLCVALLFTVTSLTILLPEILSLYRTKVITTKNEYYTVNTTNSVRLTSNTVAELFCQNVNSSFIGNGNSASVIINNAEYNESELSKDISILFDTVFADNTDIRNYFKSVIGNNTPYCSREYILTVAESRPVALSIVSISYKSEFEYFDFTYEEKTKTLISLSYVSFSEVMKNKYDTVLLFDDLQPEIESYCRTVLEIDKNNYVFENNMRTTDIANERIIYFSLVQDVKEDISEKDAYIQN